MLNARLDRALRRRFRHIERQERIEATLGDGHNNLRAPSGREGYVLAQLRLPGGIVVCEIRCVKVPPRYGLDVICTTALDGVLEAVEMDSRTALDFYGTDQIVTAELGYFGATPLVLDPRQIKALMVTPTDTPSLSVAVRGSYVYYYGGSWHSYTGGTTLDLSAKVPATPSMQRVIIVGLDAPTATLTTVDGSDVYSLQGDLRHVPFSAADVVAALTNAPVDFIPCAAVRLYNTQTAIQKWDIFIDLKALAGARDGLLHNYTATTAPTVSDDSADGYSAGSRWLNTVTDREYVCLDAAAGAAVWKETTGSGDAFRYPLRPGNGVGTAEATVITLATNGWSLSAWAYDPSIVEHVQWTVPLPSTFPTAPTATLTLHWKPLTGTGAVVWRATSLSRADGEVLDTAGNTNTFSTDTVSSDTHLHVISQTLTTTGWAANELLLLKLERVATDAADTLASDALLINAILEVV